MTNAFKAAACGLMAALCLPAFAGGSGDRWGDSHVKLHVIGEAAIAAAVTAATDSRTAGFGAAMAVGITREEWKRQRGFAHYAPSRIAADLVGAAMGAQLGHCLVSGGGVACAWNF